MNAPVGSESAAEINRLHAEVVRCTTTSREAIHAALLAAWKSGRLLVAEKKLLRRTMLGRGTWLLWLNRNFQGTPRTAQNYMRLASAVDDVSDLKGMSLRQVYFSLGIATEPKSRVDSVPVRTLPAHVRLVHRLLAALQPADFRRVPPERCAAYRQDLRALYERLRPLFESDLAERHASPLFRNLSP